MLELARLRVGFLPKFAIKSLLSIVAAAIFLKDNGWSHPEGTFCVRITSLERNCSTLLGDLTHYCPETLLSNAG